MALDQALIAYEEALDNLPSAQVKDHARKIEDQSKVLDVLIARDEIARQLAGDSMVLPATLIKITEQDRRLKDNVKAIIRIIGPSTLACWREAGQIPIGEDKPSSSPWWWLLDERATEPWYKYALKIALWIFIAIALSFIVEIVRRFVSGGVDVPSAIVQGLLALLVGSTLIQFARQLVEGISRQDGMRFRLKWRTQIILAVLLFILAVGMELSRPKIAAHYSDQGVDLRNAGQLSMAIENFQRAINLKPDDAIAHFNLASAYETVLDYDKAESEYRAAIQWDENLCAAYSKLAHLYILRRQDYVSALKLLDTGLNKIEAQRPGSGLSVEDWKRIKFSLLKNQAWAYLGLQHLVQAEDALTEALELRKDGAAAYCLQAKISDVRKNKESARTESEACVRYSKGQEDEIEPDWYSLAQERLAIEDQGKGSRK